MVAQELFDILAAVKEWRDARIAFLAVPPIDKDARFPPEIWNRLANAEDKLMAVAKTA